MSEPNVLQLEDSHTVIDPECPKCSMPAQLQEYIRPHRKCGVGLFCDNCKKFVRRNLQRNKLSVEGVDYISVVILAEKYVWEVIGKRIQAGYFRDRHEFFQRMLVQDNKLGREEDVSREPEGPKGAAFLCRAAEITSIRGFYLNDLRALWVRLPTAEVLKAYERSFYGFSPDDHRGLSLLLIRATYVYFVSELRLGQELLNRGLINSDFLFKYWPKVDTPAADERGLRVPITATPEAKGELSEK